MHKKIPVLGAPSAKGGFTLIELLIVVAIIAILAAIAVPNFLEAQVRAKVSRAKADLRTLATAVEAYAVDANQYPPNVSDSTPSAPNRNSLPPNLTTPVAYLTSISFYDPFRQTEGSQFGNKRLYTYQKFMSPDEFANLPGSYGAGLNPDELVDGKDFGNAFNFGAFDRWGKWLMLSVGPDKRFSGFADINAPLMVSLQSYATKGYDIPYDPTNGTISFGNIIRSQVHSEPFMPEYY